MARIDIEYGNAVFIRCAQHAGDIGAELDFGACYRIAGFIHTDDAVFRAGSGSNVALCLAEAARVGAEVLGRSRDDGN